MRLIIAAICLGIGCFIAGFLADACLQADYQRQKDDEIRALKGELEAINKKLYRKPDSVHDGTRYARPATVEVIDLPQADKTYHMPW